MVAVESLLLIVLHIMNVINDLTLNNSLIPIIFADDTTVIISSKN
jgi:hypothetical protein